MNLSIASTDLRTQLTLRSSLLFRPDSHAGHIQALAEVLGQITGISVQDDPSNWKSIALDTGVAISPQQAAKCLLEMQRSRIFMQGVAQAIADKVQTASTVDILYAGTGPYGLLLLPYLAAFPASPVRVTLLDIHEDNIVAIKTLVDLLQLQDKVETIMCADASRWMPPEGRYFDLVVSETMNTLLRREPQVWIFSHLQQFLKSDGHLIPQKIQLQAWLSSTRQAASSDFLLGDFFVLDRDSALRLQLGDYSLLNGEISLPDPCPQHDCLKLTTDILVYEGFHLGENQSSLNMPVYKRNINSLSGVKIQFSYRQLPVPEFVFELPQASSDNSLPEFNDTGELGIFQLKRIWHKCQLSRNGKLYKAITEKEWSLDMMVYDELGLGLELPIAVVYQSATFAEFEQWVLAINEGFIDPSVIARLNRNISAFYGVAPAIPAALVENTYTLSPQDWAFWDEHGYLVLPDVITREICEEACAAVYEFLRMKADDPNTWYADDERKHQIMVQFFRHPALTKIRENPAVHHIYRQLWQQDNLWVSTDRVSFNPPERPGWQFPGPNLHWDADLKRPLGFNTQGLVYLTDTAENQGAFTCVPGFHRRINDWLNSVPPDKDPQQQNWQQWNTKPIAAKAGALIVWHHVLPHGSSPNRASTPRIVQYVNMRPVPLGQ
jgi:hypothetical protein